MSRTFTETNETSRRKFLALSGAALGAGLFPRNVLAHLNGPADFILTDANIITQDSVRPRAEALAVKDGLIQAVGANADALALKGPNSLVVSANGRTVIPGLNDSHLHVTRGGRFYALELRWDGVGSLSRGLEMIREQAARTPEGQWVRVIGGWSPYQFAEKRLPTPAELTQAAPDTPVYVLFLYSQGYLNRKAVEVLGINRDTPAPPGTGYEFTENGGAIIYATPNPDLLYATIGALPPMSAEDQALSSRHFFRELNRFGLTSAIDAGGGGHKFPKDYAGTEALAASGDLSLRISNYLFPQNKGHELAEFEQWTHDWEAGANHAEGLMNGFVVEGGGEFLAWSVGDYENFMAGRPDITTRENWRRDLMAVTRHLLRKQWPLRIHATYDQSVNHILDVFEEAHALEIADGRSGFAAVRWAIDHGETLQKPTMARIKALGGGVAVQSRMAYAGEFFKERYGADATRNTPPLRDILNAGLPLGLGSDATRVSSYNPWATLYWATTGRSIGGEKLHAKRHQLSREEALFHHTVGSAWFSCEELLKGRLKPGQYADFAILNAPYLEVGNNDLPHIESELTIANGKPVYGVGEFAGLTSTLEPIAPEWSPVNLFGGYKAG
jgi:hypothetical protein